MEEEIILYLDKNYVLVPEKNDKIIIPLSNLEKVIFLIYKLV